MSWTIVRGNLQIYISVGQDNFTGQDFGIYMG